MRKRFAKVWITLTAIVLVACFAMARGATVRTYAEDATSGTVTITFTAGEGGTLDPQDALTQTFAVGDASDVAAVTARPSDGYAFVDWTCDGKEVSTDATFTPPKKTAAYVANFKAVAADGTNADAKGTDTADGRGTVDDSDPTKGENLDHLTGPESSTGLPDNYSAPTAPGFGTGNGLRNRLNAQLMRGNSPTGPTIGTDHPQSPGEVMLFKTATPVPGMVNTWDVTLRVEGKDSRKTSDIVLVIDTSGSMRDNYRIEEAREAANSFVDTLLSNGGGSNTHIAVVSYDSVVKTNQELTNDAVALKRAINGLRANGGTFTQAGIYRARQLLASSTADIKNIVLLSDGEPTYSYGILSPNDYLTAVGGHYETSTAVPEGQFDHTSRVGNGGTLTQQYGWYRGREARYNNGNSAIAESGFAKDDGSTMWTIALEAGPRGTGILQDIATPNHSYTASPSDLSQIYQDIAGRINDAVQDASVTDPLGTGFSVPGGSIADITATQGTASYDANEKRLHWDDLGTLTTPIDASHPDVKYAELHYRVEVDDSILDASPTDGMYATNGDARLSYIDTTGHRQDSPFPIPQVNPTLLVVEKRLYDKQGNEVTSDDPSQTYAIHVTSSNGYDQTYDLRPGERKVMTNLRLEDTYTVAETGYPSGTSAGDYSTTVTVYGQDTNTFAIRHDDPDTPVIVSNREIPSLTVKKGVTGDLSDRTKKFDFDVTVTRGGETILERTASLADGEQEGIAPDDGKVLLPGDHVTIKETNADGYSASYTVDNGTATDGTGVESSFSLAGDTTVSFTNSKQDVPITGLVGSVGGSHAPLLIGAGAILAALSVAGTRFRFKFRRGE